MAESSWEQLHRAYQLIKSGRRDEAMTILRHVIIVDPNNDDAWWLIANAADEAAQQRSALERVLLLNPDHRQAREKLDELKAAEEFRFDDDSPIEMISTPEKPKRDQPLIVTEAPRRGTNPLVIVLAIIGAISLVICGACFIITTQGAALLGSAFSSIITAMPEGLSFDRDLADLNNLTMQGSIRRGDNTRGIITSPFHYDGYTFRGETGQRITITVSTSDTDFVPQVGIYNPSGRLMETDSGFDFTATRGSVNLDASITVDELPESGEYTIVVSGWLSEGRYLLEVQ